MYEIFVRPYVFFIDYYNTLTLQIFPVVYCLMSRKTAACYTAVFKFIEKKLFQLDPKEMMTDFESGMRSAIRKYWPKVTLRGCVEFNNSFVLIYINFN